MTRRSVTLAVAVALVCAPLTSIGGAPAVAGAGVDAGRSDGVPRHRPQLKPLPRPAHFQRRVTSRYLPFLPGMRWVYRGFGSEGGDHEVVTVLSRTKLIAGVSATVVRDVVHNSGRLTERTFDWYGQDDRGRVWYLGENTKAYENGHVSRAGSWETGVHGARAGVVMFRHGRVGVRYWQEFWRGHAEDQGMLLDRDTRIGVAGGHFDHARMTKDTSPLEPRVVEFKFYARGVGVVAEIDSSPEPGRVALVSFSR
jgi:hypothetical protein